MNHSHDAARYAKYADRRRQTDEGLVRRRRRMGIKITISFLSEFIDQQALEWLVNRADGEVIPAGALR